METRYRYTTIKKGLKGLYTGSVNIPPAYKDITAFKELYLDKKPPYLLFKVTNSKGVTFYVDKKGREFYKE